MPRYEDNRYSQYDRSYENERNDRNNDRRQRNDDRYRRYEGDVFDSGRTGYRNERFTDEDYGRYGRRERDSGGLSRWIDNDHGRAAWGADDYGWRSNDRDAEEYRSRNEDNSRSGRSSGRMYTGRYDTNRLQNDFDDDDYSGRRSFGSRENRSSFGNESNYGRRGSSYGSAFNEDNERMSSGRNRTGDSDYYSGRNRRRSIWDDDDDIESTSYRNRY